MFNREKPIERILVNYFAAKSCLKLERVEFMHARHYLAADRFYSNTHFEFADFCGNHHFIALVAYGAFNFIIFVFIIIYMFYAYNNVSFWIYLLASTFDALGFYPAITQLYPSFDRVKCINYTHEIYFYSFDINKRKS